MNNQDMKEGRFLKLQAGRRLYSKIVSHLQNGGIVFVCTYTRATKLSRKHVDMIKLGKSGSVYLQSGKSWNCIDYCGIRLAN